MTATNIALNQLMMLYNFRCYLRTEDNGEIMFLCGLVNCIMGKNKVGKIVEFF